MVIKRPLHLIPIILISKIGMVGFNHQAFISTVPHFDSILKGVIQIFLVQIIYFQITVN
jgi:hypothetical protein